MNATATISLFIPSPTLPETVRAAQLTDNLAIVEEVPRASSVIGFSDIVRFERDRNGTLVAHEVRHDGEHDTYAIVFLDRNPELYEILNDLRLPFTGWDHGRLVSIGLPVARRGENLVTKLRRWAVDHDAGFFPIRRRA